MGELRRVNLGRRSPSKQSWLLQSTLLSRETPDIAPESRRFCRPCLAPFFTLQAFWGLPHAGRAAILTQGADESRLQWRSIATPPADSSSNSGLPFFCSSCHEPTMTTMTTAWTPASMPSLHSLQGLNHLRHRNLLQTLAALLHAYTEHSACKWRKKCSPLSSRTLGVPHR